MGKDAKDLEAQIAEWKKKYETEMARCADVEARAAKAEADAKESAAAKRQADSLRQSMQKKKPDEALTQRYKEEVVKLEEKTRQLMEESTSKQAEIEKQKSDCKQWREAAMDAARDVRKSVRMLG